MEGKVTLEGEVGERVKSEHVARTNARYPRVLQIEKLEPEQFLKQMVHWGVQDGSMVQAYFECTRRQVCDGIVTEVKRRELGQLAYNSSLVKI